MWKGLERGGRWEYDVINYITTLTKHIYRERSSGHSILIKSYGCLHGCHIRHQEGLTSMEAETVIHFY